MVKHPFVTVQLKSYLSGIDQNFDPENINDSLIIASNDVRQVLPVALYNKLIDSITTPPQNDADNFKEAVELLRYSMAPLAFYRAFIWLQIRVSNNSVTTYKSSDEVTAFKYQVDEAKENLLLRYAAFMKELIDFLNENIEIFTDWKDSVQQKALDELLIKDYRDFDNYFLTDGDASFFYRARVIMQEVQDEDLVPLVGDIGKILKPVDPNNPANTLAPNFQKIKQLKKALAYLTISRVLYDWDDFYLPATLRRMLGQSKSSGSGSTLGKSSSHDSDKERLSLKYRNKGLTILGSIDVQQQADKAENDFPNDPINISSPDINNSDKHYYMT